VTAGAASEAFRQTSIFAPLAGEPHFVRQLYLMTRHAAVKWQLNSGWAVAKNTLIY
jgi:hypothetical protein